MSTRTRPTRQSRRTAISPARPRCTSTRPPRLSPSRSELTVRGGGTVPPPPTASLTEAHVRAVGRPVAQRQQELPARARPALVCCPRERVTVGAGVVGERAGCQGRIVRGDEARTPGGAGDC